MFQSTIVNSVYFNQIKRLLLQVLIVWCVIFGLSFLFQQQLFGLVTKPIHDKLVFLTPFEGLDFIIKIHLLVSVLFILPVALILVINYLKDTLYPKEKLVLIQLSLAFLIGIIFVIVYGYWLIIPIVLDSLKNLTAGYGSLMISANSYFNFVITLLVSILFGFTLPIVSYILVKLNLIKYETLKSKRKIIYFSLITGTILFTGAVDLISIFWINAPLISLFELSLFLNRNHKPKLN